MLVNEQLLFYLPRRTNKYMSIYIKSVLQDLYLIYNILKSLNNDAHNHCELLVTGYNTLFTNTQLFFSLSIFVL